MDPCPRCGSPEAYSEIFSEGVLYVECTCSGEPFYAERTRFMTDLVGERMVGWGETHPRYGFSAEAGW